MKVMNPVIIKNITQVILLIKVSLFFILFGLPEWITITDTIRDYHMDYKYGIPLERKVLLNISRTGGNDRNEKEKTQATK